MKNIYLFLLLCFTVQLGTAQISYRVIGLADHIDGSIEGGFFIKQIEDQRAFKANLGIVNRGNEKVFKRPLIQEIGFLQITQDKINNWIHIQGQAEPIVMQIRELYLWEHLRRSSEKGYLHLEAAFVGQDQKPEAVISVDLSGEKLDVTNGHSIRLEEAFFQCVQKFEEQRKNAARAASLSQNNASKKVTNPGKSQVLGVYNFLDLWKGNFSYTRSHLRSSGNRILGRYILKSGKKEAEKNFYAVVKGEDWFIKANNYTGQGDYYNKVLEKGRYLFLIDDINLKPEEGMNLGEEVISNRVGIIIDMNTGIPQIVTDELMSEIMAPYPELKQRYLFKNLLKFPFQLGRVQNVIAEINRLEEQG
ncbi:MAG: hypothetical protein DHS20C18_14330 [Saprospiraceae bacterium]|nr:MAG: hypothetical protein DHS20C18_14330 [Saprospiraceae bacterium]